MNYEKAHKEAIERMKSWVKGEHPECFSEAQKAAEFIFPELKESEDEKISNAIMAWLKATQYVPDNQVETLNSWIAWLEKQGEIIDEYEDKLDRCACESFDKGYKAALEKQGETPTWGEEDENGLGDALWAIQQARTIAKDENDMWNLWYAENWLKSLKDRVRLQPKQEWDEEDEKKIMWLVRLISTAGYRELETDKMPCSRMELLEWFKSLKPNHWKPSKEQMKGM